MVRQREASGLVPMIERARAGTGVLARAANVQHFHSRLLAVAWLDELDSLDWSLPGSEQIEGVIKS